MINAGEDITVKLRINTSAPGKNKKRTVEYELFSPKLSRAVTVEEINGTTFIEARIEEELKNENRDAIENDILLSLDLMQEWAKENNYSVTHDASEIGKPRKGNAKSKN